MLYFYGFSTMFMSAAAFNLPPNPTPAQVSAALGPIFQSLLLLIPVSFGIELVAIIVLIIGLREFGHLDHERFSVPSKLIYLLVIGDIVAAAAVVPLLYSIPNIIAQAPPTSGGAPSSAFVSAISSLLGYVGIILIGGLLALVGLIGGQILGLWRVGSKYDETLIKLGAIFVIIPLLQIVAPILVLVGANSAKGKLSNA